VLPATSLQGTTTARLAGLPALADVLPASVAPIAINNAARAIRALMSGTLTPHDHRDNHVRLVACLAEARSAAADASLFQRADARKRHDYCFSSLRHSAAEKRNATPPLLLAWLAGVLLSRSS
jgi:hypothetical protein